MAMTYSQFKTQVMKLTGEYSNRGVAVAANKIADYTIMIPEVTSDLMEDMADFWKIAGEYTITRTASTDATEYTLPADYLKLDYVLARQSTAYPWSDFTNYQLYDNKIYVASTLYPIIVSLHYYKIPTRLVSPLDTDVFELPDKVMAVIAYGVAAQLHQSVGMADKGDDLWQLYLIKRSELQPPRSYFPTKVIDKYGGL